MIGVLVPTQGKRPQFMEQCMAMIAEQTQQPDHILIMDWISQYSIDLNWRYITGLQYLFNKGCDTVILWEEDDYYPSNYIERMMQMYADIGKPQLFGVNKTIYYHLDLKRYAIISHPNHSSAMSMVVSNKILTNNININNDKYDFDIVMSRAVKDSKFISIKDTLNIGIKHSITPSGTLGHKKEAGIYFKNTHNSICFDDEKGLYLKHQTGKYYEFYNALTK